MKILRVKAIGHTLLMLILLPGLFLSCGGDDSGKTEPPPAVIPPGKDEVKLEYIPFKNYAYISTDLQADKTFVIETVSGVYKAEIVPRDRGVVPVVEGNKLKFCITEKGQYVLYLNGLRIFLFVESPEVVPLNVLNIMDRGADATGKTDNTALIQAAIEEVSGTDKTLLFPEGVYLSSQLRICDKDGVKIHLSRGAVLQARGGPNDQFSVTDLFGEPVASLREPGKKAGVARGFLVIDNSKNVAITGYGAINGDGYMQRVKVTDAFDSDSNGRHRNLLVTRSEDVLIEGIMSQDPGSWNTHIILSKRVTVRNVKLMNEVQYAPAKGQPNRVNHDNTNTDGFDPDSSTDVLIEDCFGFCADDCVAVKTSQYNNLLGELHRVTVRGCVFLTMKSCLKVGTETVGGPMKEILFEDNDVIEADRALAVYCYDGADMQIDYRNTRIHKHHENRDRCIFFFEVKKRVTSSAVGKASVNVSNVSVNHKFPRASNVAYRDGATPADLDVFIDNLTVEGTRIISTVSEKCPITLTGNPSFTIQ